MSQLWLWIEGIDGELVVDVKPGEEAWYQHAIELEHERWLDARQPTTYDGEAEHPIRVRTKSIIAYAFR